MKRILFVIPTMRMGGAEKALTSLLNNLDPERVRVDLFLFEHGDVLQNQIPPWVTVLPENRTTRAMTLELRTYWKDLLRQRRISAAAARLWMSLQPPLRTRLRMKPASSWEIASRRIPALAGEYDAAIGFLEGFADFYVLDKVSAKMKVAWIHSDFANLLLPDADIDRYRQFDAYATITEACRISFSQATGVSPDRISVIENVVSANQIRAMAAKGGTAWAEDVPHILTVGRLEYQKGSDIGLEACKLLAEKGQQFCWHFIGTGSLHEKLQKKVHEYGLEKCCVFEGQKNNPYPYMQRASLIVQPSRVEGKSIVLDEAKILGKAIIAAAYPTATDQIDNGVTGVIAGTTPESIADGIIRLLKDESLRHELEKNSRGASFDVSVQAINRFYTLIEA